MNPIEEILQDSDSMGPDCFTIKGTFLAINDTTTVGELLQLEKSIERIVSDYDEDEGFSIHRDFRYTVFRDDLWEFFDVMVRWKADFDEITMEGLGAYGAVNKALCDLARHAKELKEKNDREGFYDTWDQIADIIINENTEDD